MPLHGDPFANTATARAFLARWTTGGTVTRRTLALLRAWRTALVAVLGQVTADEPVSDQHLGAVNALAIQCSRVRSLTGTLDVTDEVREAREGAHAIIARCIDEIGFCDPSRIRRCARPACGLFFYDLTRNRSARWHAEHPCGWRTRDERRR